MSFGGQGARREAGSEGYAEKYRAVVDEGYLKDEPVGRRWDKVEPALWGRRTCGSIHGELAPPETRRRGQRSPHQAIAPETAMKQRTSAAARRDLRSSSEKGPARPACTP